MLVKGGLVRCMVIRWALLQASGARTQTTRPTAYTRHITQTCARSICLRASSSGLGGLGVGPSTTKLLPWHSWCR